MQRTRSLNALIGIVVIQRVSWTRPRCLVWRCGLVVRTSVFGWRTFQIVAASVHRSLSGSYLHLSHPDYCDSLLAGVPQSTLGVLQRVQNAAARLIFELGPRHHVTDSLIQLHWPLIRWRVQYKLVMLMYGIVVGTCPEYLRTIVEPATPSHPGLRSAACSAPKFVVPRLRTKFSERAFSFSGPVAWNSLPADIRCTTNRQTFKTFLPVKLLIFHSYC